MAASPASAWASASSASPASASASSAVHHGTLPVWHAGVPTTYPSHPVLRLWNSMVIITIVAVSWIYPYLFGFVNIHEITMAWTIGDGVVCAILFTDQLVLLTTSGKSIWMIFDISSLIPLKLILLLPVSTPIKFILANTCNFSRLIHVRKVFKTLSNWRPGMRRNYDFFLRGTFLFFVSLFSVHMMGCIFYIIASNNPHLQKSWLSLQQENEDDVFSYITSVYWAMTTLTTVGYGDIHALSGIEMVVSVLLMIFTTCLLCYVTTDFIELLAAISRFRKLGDPVKSMREIKFVNRLSDNLTTEIQAHFTQRGCIELKSKEEFEILSYFPNQLKSRLKSNLFMEHIKEVYLFAEVSPIFLFQLISEIEIETFYPNEMVVVSNEFPTKFYITLNGEVRAINEERSSVVCGEVGVLCCVSQPYGFVNTNTTSVLLTITRESIMKLFELHSQDAKMILVTLLIEMFLKYSQDHDQTLLCNEDLQRSFQDKGISLPNQAITSYYAKAIRNRDNILLALVHIFSGHDVNIITNEGWTPLHMSIIEDNVEAAEYLLRHNASWDATNSTGVSAREKATAEGSNEIKNLMSRSFAN